MELELTDIYPDMDPRLQYAADRRNRGVRTSPPRPATPTRSG